MTDFWKDEELQKFGDMVAGKYHADKLASARFIFIFQDPPKKLGKDRLVAGKASKVSKQWKDIGVIDADYIITIAEKVYRLMSGAEREALIDHELCHCDVVVKEDGSIKYGLKAHDLQDFLEIYERHGAWQEDLKALILKVKEEEAKNGRE